MRKSNFNNGIRLQVEVVKPHQVRVKSYTRVRNGKVEKVQSYLRRVETANEVTIRISSR